MFENKPMPIHTPSGQTSTIKSLQANTTQLTKPVPAPKAKPFVGNKVAMPDGFKKELLNKQNLKTVPQPQLPKKDKRLSFDTNGDIVSLKPSEILAASKASKPSPPGVKEKPKVVPRINNNPPLTNNNESSDSQAESVKTADRDVELVFIGDPITNDDGDKYRMIKCPPKSSSPPLKPRLPSKFDIDDILRKLQCIL